MEQSIGFVPLKVWTANSTRVLEDSAFTLKEHKCHLTISCIAGECCIRRAYSNPWEKAWPDNSIHSKNQYCHHSKGVLFSPPSAQRTEVMVWALRVQVIRHRRCSTTEGSNDSGERQENSAFQKPSPSKGYSFTCIEAAEGQNSHILQPCGSERLQYRKRQSVQCHRHIYHQRVKPAISIEVRLRNCTACSRKDFLASNNG